MLKTRERRGNRMRNVVPRLSSIVSRHASESCDESGCRARSGDLQSSPGIGSTGTECLGPAGRAIVELLQDERRLSSEAFEAAES